MKMTAEIRWNTFKRRWKGWEGGGKATTGVYQPRYGYILRLLRYSRLLGGRPTLRYDISRVILCNHPFPPPLQPLSTIHGFTTLSIFLSPSHHAWYFYFSVSRSTGIVFGMLEASFPLPPPLFQPGSPYYLHPRSARYFAITREKRSRTRQCRQIGGNDSNLSGFWHLWVMYHRVESTSRPIPSNVDETTIDRW